MVVHQHGYGQETDEVEHGACYAEPVERGYLRGRAEEQVECRLDLAAVVVRVIGVECLLAQVQLDTHLQHGLQQVD